MATAPVTFAAPPSPAPKALADDAEIQFLAKAALRTAQYLAVRLLACTVHDRVLTLHGRVPSYYLKQLASLAVSQIEGVERIDNQVQVS